MIQARLLHQVKRRGPVAMTVEQCSDYPAAQQSRKCFLIGFRVEGCDDFIAAREAANMQALLVRRTTAFFCQAEDGIRVPLVTGVQTCALPICRAQWTVSVLCA